MNFFDELKRRAAGQPPARYPNRPETTSLREALEAAQRLKRAESYQAALEALGSARQLANSSGDANSMAVVALNLADVYGRLQRFDDANTILNEILQTAQETRQRGQIAYILMAQGTLAQRQGDWKTAQTQYERALEVARSARSVGAEGRAMGYLAVTYLHDANASYAIHLLREALPKLNQAGDLELSSLFVGTLGEALISSGQEVEGQQLLERALRLGRQIGYRMYERQWSVVLAERALNLGQSEEAYQYLDEALTLFDAKTQANDYVNALILMTKTCLNLQRLQDGLAFAQQAARVAALAAYDEHIAIRADVTLGIVLVACKDYESAIPYLELVSELIASQPVELKLFSETDIVRNLAAAKAEVGDEAGAADTYRHAAQRATKTGSRLEAAQAARDLGLFFANRQNMTEAIKEWSQALTLYDAENQKAQVARLYCDLAAARKFIGQGQRAQKDCDLALMLLSSLREDWETRGLVLANAAIAYADQGDVDSADSFFNESIAIARRLNNDYADATRRGNYGWFLMATGRSEQALSMLEYALRLSKNIDLSLQAAIQTDNLGLSYDLMGNYDKGLGYHREAASLVAALNKPHWQHSINMNMANALVGLNQADEAKPLFEGALMQGRGTNDVELIIRALTGIALVNIREGRANDSVPLLEEAVTLARKAEMRRLHAEALTVYSQQQAALNQGEQAGKLWQEAQKLFTILRAPQASTQPAWLKA
ncbi:MAG: hypothetical protein LCI00_18265 [Chloroflexi bacterium]|nr:hypothetical protein [Chloroflexota bacterium]MCC6897148.1 tetratricopeptide repeat protein [Anaerolineae bacterium]